MEVEIDGIEYVRKEDGDLGHKNSGYKNSGNRNSGHWNSGDLNSGNCNSGNCNSGHCNSDNPRIRMFNKDTKLIMGQDNIDFPDYFYFDLTEWIPIQKMTDAEKEKYPDCKVTIGFLRVHEFKEAWKLSFDKASKSDVKETLKLPNFDYKIFEEISGITKKMIDKKLKD